MMTFFWFIKNIIKYSAVSKKQVCLICICILQIWTAYSPACTIGVANGHVTVDGRPIMWKIRDISEATQQLIHSSGSPYDYIGVRSEGGSILMGLNEAGVASGNSLVNPDGLQNTNSSTQQYILRNYDSLYQISDYFHLKIEPYSTGGRGCFPFIDASGNAIMFELNGPEWWLEYSSMDHNREAQDLLGFVVRANEFHQHLDGTDDTSILGRYRSGSFNIKGLRDLGQLSVKTITQGNSGPNMGFEFARYGPGRTYFMLARPTSRSFMAVHGVALGEDPALTTMWVMLGHPNYSLAVPAWVRVSDIPASLASGDMYLRAKSLYDKNENDFLTTQESTFPMEGHIFDVVMNELLPHWRIHGVPSIPEMTRIQHQIASDAYSLLYCLDLVQYDNKPPHIEIEWIKQGRTVDFSAIAFDPDGSVIDVDWDFGDGATSSLLRKVHQYSENGYYLVSCTVTDDKGVSNTDWKYILIQDDGIVNLDDLMFLLDHWLIEIDCCEEGHIADLNEDCNVDLLDFAILASHWMEAINIW